MKARLTNTKLKGEARSHAEQHFLAGALKAVHGDRIKLVSLYQCAANGLEDPFHYWSAVHQSGKQAAIVHALNERAAESLRHAVFEVIP